MYSGLLPRGLTEYDVSSDDEDEEKESEDETVVKINESKDSPHVVADANSESATCSLSGVSQEHWQKFCEIRRRKEEARTVASVPRRKRKRHRKRDDKNPGAEKAESAETSRQHQDEKEKHWDGLKQYFGANDRFHPPACSNPSLKSGLERSIERAIAEGDIAKAEEMSDRLATRELGVKIAEAADCRDFVKNKQTEEDLRNSKKRKKQIPWGFEAKQRWETKSNMGFM